MHLPVSLGTTQCIYLPNLLCKKAQLSYTKKIHHRNSILSLEITVALGLTELFPFSLEGIENLSFDSKD